MIYIRDQMIIRVLLIKIEWIDEYLEGFEVVENEVSKLTEEICSEL